MRQSKQIELGGWVGVWQDLRGVGSCCRLRHMQILSGSGGARWVDDKAEVVG